MIPCPLGRWGPCTRRRPDVVLRYSPCLPPLDSSWSRQPPFPPTTCSLRPSRRRLLDTPHVILQNILVVPVSRSNPRPTAERPYPKYDCCAGTAVLVLWYSGTECCLLYYQWYCTGDTYYVPVSCTRHANKRQVASSCVLVRTGARFRSVRSSSCPTGACAAG